MEARSAPTNERGTEQPDTTAKSAIPIPLVVAGGVVALVFIVGILTLCVIFSFVAVVQTLGAAKIDATTEDSFKASMEKVKKPLSAEEREEFEKAVKVIAFDGIDNIFELASESSDGLQRRLKDRLDGKTAQQVISEGKAVIQKRENEQRKQIEGEIVDLMAKKASAKEAALKLAAFKVERSRFSFSTGDFFSGTPKIELTVRNGTPHAVSRAYFHGTLASPGRSVPWVEDDFSYEIPGGLEPGETATWNLAPNQFGEWGRAPKDRKDMVLTVRVRRLDGPDGEEVLDGEFSKYEQDRLDELQRQLIKP